MQLDAGSLTETVPAAHLQNDARLRPPHRVSGPTYATGQFLQNYFVPDAYDPSQAVSILAGAGVLRGSIVPGSGNFLPHSLLL